MKYLIFATKLDAIERNHEESCKRAWPTWIPRRMSDGPYWWAMVTHPTNGEVALRIPEAETDPEAGFLDAGEIADLDNELTPDWTPTDG
jgi:hypothetical protein